MTPGHGMPTVAELADRIRNWEELRIQAETIAGSHPRILVELDAALEQLYAEYMPRAQEVVDLLAAFDPPASTGDTP